MAQQVARTSAQSVLNKTNIAAELASQPDFSPPTVSHQALRDGSIVDLEAEVARWRAVLTPIDVRALAIALDATLALWPLPATWETIGAFYLEALREFPAALVHKALRLARLNSKFFPRPVELREHISSDMADLRDRLRMVETAVRNRASRLMEEHRRREVPEDRGWYLRSDAEILALLGEGHEVFALRRIAASLAALGAGPAAIGYDADKAPIGDAESERRQEEIYRGVLI
jgi:hypothetical protein